MIRQEVVQLSYAEAALRSVSIGAISAATRRRVTNIEILAKISQSEPDCSLQSLESPKRVADIRYCILK